MRGLLVKFMCLIQKFHKTLTQTQSKKLVFKFAVDMLKIINVEKSVKNNSC